MSSCAIVIRNRITTDAYQDAIRTVYAPNKGPITEEIILPEGKGLSSADAFYANNGEILKQAAINLSSK